MYVWDAYRQVSLWVRNIQLGFFGFILGIGAVYVKVRIISYACTHVHTFERAY